MGEGFFELFLEKVVKAINDNVQDETIIEVKHVRRIMDISSKNRSKTAFVSRALQKLSDDGHLEYMGKGTARKYKKTDAIVYKKR